MRILTSYPMVTKNILLEDDEGEWSTNRFGTYCQIISDVLICCEDDLVLNGYIDISKAKINFNKWYRFSVESQIFLFERFRPEMLEEYIRNIEEYFKDESNIEKHKPYTEITKLPPKVQVNFNL